MHGLHSRVRTFQLLDSLIRTPVDLPSTVPAATITDADAVVLSGDAHWVSSTARTIRALGIEQPILVVHCERSADSRRNSLSAADLCLSSDANDDERAE